MCHQEILFQLQIRSLLCSLKSGNKSCQDYMIWDLFWGDRCQLQMSLGFSLLLTTQNLWGILILWLPIASVVS